MIQMDCHDNKTWSTHPPWVGEIGNVTKLLLPMHYATIYRETNRVVSMQSTGDIAPHHRLIKSKPQGILDKAFLQ